jgi:phosphate transport system permease protein
MSGLQSASTFWSRSGGELLFKALALVCVAASLLVLATLLLDVLIDGYPRLTWQFLSGYPSRFADKAGAAPAILGSIYIIILTAIIALPLGVGAALYLEEYAPDNWITRFIELNIANLAGVPSIIFGLLGLQLFVRWAGFDRSLLAGACTMAVLVLPIIVLASREALRAVPGSIRDASLALGATKWQTIWRQVLPIAFPGILTGCILAFSRALGETAPLVTLGALTYVPFLPDGIFSAFTVLPIQAFNWTSRPQAAFHHNAAAAIVILLAILLTLNSLAIWLRGHFQQKSRL